MMENELSPQAITIVKKMMAELEATPFDGRTKAAIEMLDNADLMAGHREEIESYFKRHYYWNQ